MPRFLGGESSPAPAVHAAFGRYRLLERIGRGGMAEVFKAKSFGVEGFEKVLVIKRIVPALATRSEFVDMFVREAKLAVRLSHANIVQVFDLGRIDHDDRPASYFIAMEYVPGVDLATVLTHCRKHKEQLPLGMAVFVATEVAKALDHAHRRTDDDLRPLGIVHRDVSPQNILLSWDGDVKVTDFGIAKAADTIDDGDSVRSSRRGGGEGGELSAARAHGKQSHMSPEQARGNDTDARSDLFSLGVVLYEMVTGANPFTGASAQETSRRLLACEYPPVPLARETPEALVAIVDRLLQLSPDDRFANAAELAEQLLGLTYTAGLRYAAADLARLLEPLRRVADGPELEPATVFEEDDGDAEQTPVEVPQAHTRTSGTAEQRQGARRAVDMADRADAARATQRREVSAVVLRLDATEREPRELKASARRVLERHGAWVDEQGPNQLVGVFGCVDPDGRDAESAVRAARVLVRERNEGTVPSAGVHSGPIAVHGDLAPVHDERLASLLATAQALARATEGQVAVSPLTARLVRRSFQTEPLPEPARATTDGGHVVTGGTSSEERPSRFVGRRAELKQLGSILAAATRLEPQLVVITGETGLGKSRLIGEARRRLDRGHFNVAFYSAACPPGGASVPWSGLRAMLHVLCGTQEDDDTERILEVRPRLRALGLGDDQQSAVLGMLGALPSRLGLRSSEAATRPALRAAFERMVLSLCRDRLHCLAWDDAQNMDRETFDVLMRVMRHRTGLRAVLLLSLRGEVPRRLAEHPLAHVIELSDLGRREVELLVEHQLKARIIPGELLRYVRSCAGGHPLFVEELLRELLDTGVVRVLNGSVVIEDDAQPIAPRPLRTLVASRVNRLHPPERTVLQGVAVLGEPAFSPIVATVLEMELPVLDRHLGVLEAEGLVRRSGATKVRFASPLYQEIVLDTLTLDERRALHARAAVAYQRSRGAGGEATLHIAEHLFEAGDVHAAVDQFWVAAAEKLEVGQLESAVGCMLDGLDGADVAERPVEQLCQWLRTLSKTASQVRSGPGLRHAVAGVLREIERRGTAAQRAGASIDVARALGAVNLFDEAFETLARGAAEAASDADLQRESLVAEIELSARQGRFADAARAADRLEAHGPDDYRSLLVICQARAATGDCDRALELLERVEAQSDPDDVVTAIAAQKQRVLIHFNSRQYARAAVEATKLADTARAAGLRFDAAAALHNLGDACARMGDHPRAYAAFVASLDLSRVMEHDRLAALNQMHLCFLDSLRKVEGAEERLKALIRYADGRDYVWDVLEGRLLLARMCLEQQDGERARKQLEDVKQMAADNGHKLILDDASELLNRM